MRIRVITLNLLHGAPVPGGRVARASVEHRLAWTAEHLREEAPDVVLLQEASVSRRHGHTAQQLARRLGLAFVYARANPTAFLGRLAALRPFGRIAFEEGPAVLTRLPIVAHHVHMLSRPSLFERRIALEAVLDGPDGRFSVFSVHLTTGSRAARRHQLATLRAAVDARAHPQPTIVGGDFNAEEHEDDIRVLVEHNGWVDSFRRLNATAAGLTWGQRLGATAATAAKRIDFLFAVPSRHARWTPSHSRLVLDRALPHGHDGVRWASDHYGVLTDFETASAQALWVE